MTCFPFFLFNSYNVLHIFRAILTSSQEWSPALCLALKSGVVVSLFFPPLQMCFN